MKFLTSVRAIALALITLFSSVSLTLANASESEILVKLDRLVERGFLPHYQLSTVNSKGVSS